MFAEVVLSKVSSEIDKIYHYAIPENLRGKIQVGHQVIVPFGRRQDVGYVVGFVKEAEVTRVKEIIKITSPCPLFGKEQVEFAKWLAYYYFSFFATALKLMLPPGQKPKELSSPQSRLKSPLSPPGIEGKEVKVAETNLRLTPEQQKALEAIKGVIDQGRSEKFLLCGVTGSGKTEVYLQAIAYLLTKGKSALVLVPEIALTPQLIQRFQERFPGLIAVLHSHMTLKQRNQAWLMIYQGETRVVLGTRSALFAPIKNLGLIVVDEEYEVSYKSEKSPRYHTREAALKWAEINKAVLILGSATPAVETYYLAESGFYRKLVLPQRIDQRPLPPVEIVDMRKEKDFLLSRRLREELKEVLAKGEQAILFVNRRGFFTLVICRRCGLVLECPKCSLSLTYLPGKGLVCFGCGYSVPSLVCPRCQGTELKYFGVGTQRIEKEVAEMFPSARILRWDRDAVSKSSSHEAFFSAFAQGKANVLIGTQMVIKGLDVAKVTLVGVVSADFALHLPDFRAAEHTFQLLTQAAGRAGRHHLPGKVIIQSFYPEHYALQAAAHHDYESFYQKEISYRKELNYPPFSKLICLLISGSDQDQVKKVAQELANFLKRREVQGLLGPVPAVIARRRGQWRYRILLKGKDLEEIRPALAETLAKIVVPKEIKVLVDVDPVNLL